MFELKSSILIFYIIYLYAFLDHQQLIELGAELKKHCAANSSSCVPKVGEPCCAMISSETPVLVVVKLTKESFCVPINLVIFVVLLSPFLGDGEWYRVMVDILAETTVSVNFVDYGYSMKLPIENLRPITLSLLTLPFQAVRCSLAGTMSVKICSCGQYKFHCKMKKKNILYK